MQKTRITAHIALYLLFVLALWCLFSLTPQPPVLPLTPDLTQADLATYVYREPGTSWQTYPEALLTPETLASATPVPVPSEAYKTLQYATHALKLRLPPDALYAITLNSVDYAMRIFIDGEELPAVGHPGATRAETIPRVLEKTYFFTPATADVTLIIQAANFVHGKGGCQPPAFTLGTADHISRIDEWETFSSAIISGCLLMAGLYHLALFMLNRRRLTALAFSGCCLLLALFSKRLIFMMFPAYNWFIGIRVEYMVHFLTFVMLVWFTARLFPGTLARPITRAYYALALLFMCTLVLDSYIFTGLLVYFEIASALMILYVLARMALSLRRGGIKHTLGFAGLLVLCLLGMNDLLYYRGIIFIGLIGGQTFTTPIGMIFFVLCYALLIALEYEETEQAMITAIEGEQRLAADNAALDRIAQMKSDLIATISHETRTPLAVLSGYAEIISMEMRSKGVDDQTAGDLARIADETQRIASIMEEMQGLSRARDASARMAPTRLDDLIRQSARLYTPILARRKTTLHLDLPDGLPPVLANADALTQVLFNLLSNARNHTEGGSVTLTARHAQGHLTVSIADTGEGVRAAFLPHAFEKGSHDHPDGHGIGLAICRDILREHGGEIWMESEEGKGTTVHFYLPALEEETHG